MNSRTWANKYRPSLFADVVGQESETDILKKIVTGTYRPPVILFSGPFGTGKTSLARLTTKAVLCTNRQGPEPCGVCFSCVEMAKIPCSHVAYTELDAATNGLVANVREIKDLLDYRASGEWRIILFDEAHMLTQAAQSAMLQMLEEGRSGVVLMFCTTESGKLLPTIKSRCVELDLKLLTVKQIVDRLRKIAELEKITVEDRAIRVISTYVRGHLRDAITLMQQISATAGEVSEELVRAYLRLDKNVSVYEFLVLKDKKSQMEKLEELLCTFSVSELQEIMGQALLNAYKLGLGLGDFDQLDEAWLTKIRTEQGDALLDKAEEVMTLEADFATIQHATVSFARVFAGGVRAEIVSGKDDRSLINGFRKPKEAGA